MGNNMTEMMTTTMIVWLQPQTARDDGTMGDDEGQQ